MLFWNVIATQFSLNTPPQNCIKNPDCVHTGHITVTAEQIRFSFKQYSRQNQLQNVSSLPKDGEQYSYSRAAAIS